jgi:hypothetical protein
MGGRALAGSEAYKINVSPPNLQLVITDDNTHQILEFVKTLLCTEANKRFENRHELYEFSKVMVPCLLRNNHT